jgi:LsmAD domain
MTGFRTDADISRGVDRGERPLQPWIPDAAEDVDLSLDSAGSAGWDQFEANNRLFGTSSTFDEHLYTTKIDRSAPSYRERERQAAKLAKEIEGTTSTNAHMREERGHAWENDGEDEEDKYSGVRRDDHNFPPLQSGLSNKYTPPARRAPTGLPTVAGAPVDPAIISAQLSRPDSAKSTQSKPQHIKDTENRRTEASSPLPKRAPSPAVNPEPIDRSEKKVLTSSTSNLSADQGQVKEKGSPAGSSISSQRRAPENATEDVENKLLNQFKAFAASEKMRVQQSQRTRASNDRQAKLKELLNFSESFKLRTPVPTDLVGILAKDPAKQEQIVEKARKEHEELPKAASPASHSVAGIEAKPPPKTPAVGKFDPSMVPAPIPDRQTFNRTRQAYPAAPARNERAGQPPAGHPPRGGPGFGLHRTGGLQHDRRSIPPQSIPTPIPIHEGRVPPLGPLADQSGLSSPQRSSVHTPTSAISTKFNAKASEFRPNAVAPAFTPAGTSIAPPSPKPIEPVRTISGTASPSSFFGATKPKPAAERPAFVDYFNPIPRMKREVEQQKEQTKKDYSNNGGIPPAYNTPPRWDVAEHNQDRTYKDVFDKLIATSASPAPSVRSVSTQQIPYQQPIPYHLPNGTHNIPQVHAPHHAMQHTQSQHQHNHYEDGHSRMHMAGTPQVFPSPRLGSGQMVYTSPMGHSNPVQYGQPIGQFIPAQGGPSPMHMRQYPATPQFMHAQTQQMGAPMMAHQPSNGPYMGLPQQQYQHMPMYSPNPAQAYPQHAQSQPHSGYPSPSPSRAAPMMMHQGSQQGHHPGQHLYGTPQPAQMGYGQYGQPPPMRGGYPGQHTPYGTSPGQAYHYPPQPQRTMSSGYGGGYQGKVPMQHMQPSQGPPAINGVPQQAGYPSQDVPVDMAK